MIQLTSLFSFVYIPAFFSFKLKTLCFKIIALYINEVPKYLTLNLELQEQQLFKTMQSYNQC